MRFSKFIVTLVILLNVVFTGAVLYVFLKVGSEPSTLIGTWFAFTTGELWMLAGIRKKKIEKESNENNNNESEEIQ
jgi:threonine/homoserine efflux transporter RhtA